MRIGLREWQKKNLNSCFSKYGSGKIQIERANWSYFSKACILPIASKKASAVVPFCIKSKSKSTPRTFKSLDSHWPPGMGMKGTSKPLVPKMRISWRQNWQREIKYPEEEAEEKKYISLNVVHLLHFCKKFWVFCIYLYFG